MGGQLREFLLYICTNFIVVLQTLLLEHNDLTEYRQLTLPRTLIIAYWGSKGQFHALVEWLPYLWGDNIDILPLWAIFMNENGGWLFKDSVIRDVCQIMLQNSFACLSLRVKYQERFEIISIYLESSLFYFPIIQNIHRTRTPENHKLSKHQESANFCQGYRVINYL